MTHHSAETVRRARERPAALWERMAKGAERKADFWAASDAPWALGNLRLYQDKMVLWGRYADCARALEAEAATARR
jgi:hypothetical protein